MIQLRPMETSDFPLLWGWMNEFRKWNFDDDGPKTEHELADVLMARSAAGGFLVTVLYNDEPVGSIGFSKLTSRLAVFQGICFTRAVHGTGVPTMAVRHIMDLLKADGVEKLSAEYHADNGRVRKFLRKLGFEDEGLLKDHIIRGGEPVGLRMVAWFPAKEDVCHSVAC